MVQLPPAPQVVEDRFDDIDALAASALAWDQHYEQIGRGRFEGRLTQFLMGDVQLGRESWSPGCCSAAARRPALGYSACRFSPKARCMSAEGRRLQANSSLPPRVTMSALPRQDQPRS